MQGFSLKGGENFNTSDFMKQLKMHHTKNQDELITEKGENKDRVGSVSDQETQAQWLCVYLLIFTQALTTAWLYSKDRSHIPLADNQRQK